MLQKEDGQADGQQAETGSGEQSDVTQPVDEQDEEGSVLRNDVRAGDEISPWAELQSTLDNVSEVVLMDDYTAGADDAALVIPADSTVILDLNGHTLNRNLTSEEENGSVIINNGRLTITGEGKITGGAIVNYGTLTISSGTISGNSAIEGGAVFNDAQADLVITGGGISVIHGTLIMENVTVMEKTGDGPFVSVPLFP